VKLLLTVSAVMELTAGGALLGLPSATVALLIGATLESPAALTVARIAGGGLLALGVACWLARADAQSPAARGLVAGMLLYNVIAVAVLAYAGIGFGLRGPGLWPVVVLHALMTVWCVVCLRRGPL
jgi:hypothetical protein